MYCRFVLRKIIRRAAYAANRVMKTKPGVLSSLVPSVAETLDFFPEVSKHIDEVRIPLIKFVILLMFLMVDFSCIYIHR